VTVTQREQIAVLVSVLRCQHAQIGVLLGLTGELLNDRNA